jgi:tRNA(Arg) A34 adenosine deaminase TadA
MSTIREGREAAGPAGRPGAAASILKAPAVVLAAATIPAHRRRAATSADRIAMTHAPASVHKPSAVDPVAMSSVEPSADQVARLLRRAHGVARAAMDAGHHPFGALLVAPDHETVLLEQRNVDSVNHAEAVLAREAARAYAPAYLWNCSLVTTVEPCAMCAGTQYWAHIGRLIYGMSERRLLALTGNHAENPTLDLPSRDVFARGQKRVVVIGPVTEVEDEIGALHRWFWRQR